MTRDDVERAYADVASRRGSPHGAAAFTFRRLYVGARLPRMLLVRHGDDLHYESRARPIDVPEAARWVTARSENGDGGPSLANPVAILDLRHPHAIEDVAVLAGCWPAFLDAGPLVAELHSLVADWGTSPLQRVVWLSPRLATAGLVGTIAVDVLGELRTVVCELASGCAGYGGRADEERWQALAARGTVWPDCVGDPYGARTSLPAAWVGRRVADTPSPFARVARLEASGFRVDALGGDLAVLVMP
jgi:hypothetical protein